MRVHSSRQVIANARFRFIDIEMADGQWVVEGSRGSASLEKTSHNDSRGETTLREEERLGSRHLRVVQRHLLFLPYDPYEIRYLRRSLLLSSSIYLSVESSLGRAESAGTTWRDAHTTRVHGV